MGTWLNGDGLYVKFGTTEGNAGRGGQYRSVGPLEVIDLEVTLSNLTTSAETILSDVVAIPKGAFIQRTEVVVLTTSAGTNSNLDIGLVDMDRSSNAAAQALVAAGDAWHEGDEGVITVYEDGTTEAGTIYGTPLATAKLITAGAETAAFTAGVIRIRVYYFMP